MRRYVKPKKSFGQHFLTDQPTARAIADTVDACPDLPLLEVGPGTGMLTQYLTQKGRPLKVVEVDRESVAYLRKSSLLPEEGIVEADFLRLPLDTLFGGQPFVLTGNYPYNISTQIFFKLLDNRSLIPCCTGMVQREVALRLASPPGGRTYGVLSVLVQAWYDVDYLFTVEPDVFNPPPKVRSAVVRLTRNDRQELGCDEAMFARVVKHLFQQRRKMMRAPLRTLLPQLDPPGAARDHSAFLSQSRFDQRPEQLSVEQFVELTRDILNETAGQS